MNMGIEQTGAVLERRSVEPTRQLSLVGRRGVEIPRGWRVLRVMPDMTEAGEDVTLKGGTSEAASGPAQFWVVSPGPFRLFLPLESILTDAEGNAWDLHLNLDVVVSDVRRFLDPSLLVEVTPYRPLTPEGLGVWLQERLSTGLHRRLDGESLATLQARHARSMEAWQEDLGDLVQGWGLRVVLGSRPVWTSPTAEARERERELEAARVKAEAAAAEERRAEDARRRNAALQEALREKMRAAANDAAAARDQVARQKALQEEQRAIAEAEALQAQQLNSRFGRELAEAEHRVKLAAQETRVLQQELAQAQLASDAERIRARREEATAAEARLKQAEEQAAAVAAQVGTVAGTVAELLARAVGLGAGIEVLQGSVNSMSVLFQQSDARVVARFDQLEAQLQELGRQMTAEAGPALDERKAVLASLEGFFSEYGGLGAGLQQQVQKGLDELQAMRANINDRFTTLQTVLEQGQKVLVDHLDGHFDTFKQGQQELMTLIRTILDQVQAFGLNPVGLEALVEDGNPLRPYLRQPAGRGGCRLHKSNLERRDLGVLTRDYKPKRAGAATPPPVTGLGLDCVEIDAPVDLEIHSTLRGHLTLINLGTSGTSYLISPHRYVAVPRPLEPERSYRIPGPELLPQGRLEQEGFESVGAGAPCGEECFVAFVTPEPLLRWNDPRLVPDVLFPVVPPALLAEVERRFRAVPEGMKAVGTLKYLVVSRRDRAGG